MVDPLTLGILLASFAKSFASQAGSRTADLVFDAVTRPQAPQFPTDQLARDAAVWIQDDPRFAEQAAAAINADIVSFPQAAQSIVERTPGFLQRVLGISSDEATAKKGTCPVGGHRMLSTPTYLLPDGSPVSAWTTFAALRSKSPLMRARCNKGHIWLVFDVTA